MYQMDSILHYGCPGVDEKSKMTSTSDKNKNVPHESQADTGKNIIFCVI